MAFNVTKIPANVGAASTVSGGGNPGWTEKLYHYQYFVTGTPAAVTAVPLGAVPAPSRVIGVSAALATPINAAGLVNIKPVKIPCDGTGTAVNLVSTIGNFSSSAVGPAITSTFLINGVSNTVHSSSTGITDFVLDTTVTFNQGDYVGITTSGTFTSSVGLAVDIWLREENGAY